MTFLHKLAQRLARMKAPILMGVLLTTACEQIPATGPTGTGTGAGTQEPVAVVASVSVSPGAVSATTGQTVQLTAIPRDANGTPLLGRTVTWRSSNAAVVTVNANGIATGVPAGSATITATSEGKSGSAAITVTSDAGARSVGERNPGHCEPADRADGPACRDLARCQRKRADWA